MVNYRPFLDTDVEKLVKLINDNVDFEKKGKKMTVQQLNEWFDEPGEEIREHTFIAETEEEIVGYQALCLVKDEEKINAFAYGSVHYRWRGKGIGTRLIKMSIECLKRKSDEERPIIYNHLVRVSTDQYELANPLGYQKLTELDSYLLEIGELEKPFLEDYTIDSVGKNNVDDISQVYGLAFSWHPSETGLSPESLLYEMTTTDYANDLNLVCLIKENVLIGYISGYLEGKGRGVVSTIAVHPNYQGKGIGKAMLQELLYRMREKGVQHVRLSVDSNNPTAAIKLYERFGFKKGERIIHYFVKIK